MWYVVIGWLSEQCSWGDVTIDISKIKGKLIIGIAVKINVNCISVLESSGRKWHSGKWEMISCDYFVRELRDVLDLWLQIFSLLIIYILCCCDFKILGNLKGIIFTYGFQKNLSLFQNEKIEQHKVWKIFFAALRLILRCCIKILSYEKQCYQFSHFPRRVFSNFEYSINLAF